MTAIVNGRILTPEGIVTGKALLFARRIVGTLNPVDVPSDVRRVDADGLYVVPGFIDVHIHGSGGADVMDAVPEALKTIARTLPQTGTTSFLATTMSMPLGRIEAALENIRRQKAYKHGAEILGAHLEGPFLNPSRAGAQDAAHMTACDADWVLRHADVVRMITIAPEMPGAHAFVTALRRTAPHIVISAGHSEATYDEASYAFTYGVRHVTHLFNAMGAYHHRKPGLVGALFDHPSVTADIIADGVHTHPHHLRLAHRMLHKRVMLITDAMRAGCMRSGVYELGGQTVTVSQREARLENGTLAGSVLQMHDALRRWRKATGCDFAEAVDAATRRPAKLLGLERKGRLIKGADADIVICDEAFRIRQTYVAGRQVYGVSS